MYQENHFCGRFGEVGMHIVLKLTLLSKNKIRKSELATAVIKLELNHIFDLLVRLLSYKIIKTFGLSHSIIAQNRILPQPKDYF